SGLSSGIASCWEKSRRSIQPLEFGNSKSSLRAGCSSLKVKSMSQISRSALRALVSMLTKLKLFQKPLNILSSGLHGNGAIVVTKHGAHADAASSTLQG